MGIYLVEAKMICPVCGEEFKNNVAGNKKYCSYSCRDKYRSLKFRSDVSRLEPEELKLRKKLFDFGF